jgi:amino acid transporter
VHAELGGMFPVSGGTDRFPHYAFGGAAGASFGWFSWLQAATVALIEVLAMITYGRHYSWAKLGDQLVVPGAVPVERGSPRGGDLLPCAFPDLRTYVGAVALARGLRAPVDHGLPPFRSREDRASRFS